MVREGEKKKSEEGRLSGTERSYLVGWDGTAAPCAIDVDGSYSGFRTHARVTIRELEKKS